ncbi:MAG: hypothetical protein U5L11_07355 [Arhodomonas sp.]|nr:hypothetical protein [Arhodomonas sp.]
MPSQLDTWFMEELVRRSEGAIEFGQYWSSSLYSVGDHLPAVRDNRTQMSLISPGYYESGMPVTRGLEWYYRMQRADALQRVCRDVYRDSLRFVRNGSNATALRSCTGRTGITHR